MNLPRDIEEALLYVYPFIKDLNYNITGSVALVLQGFDFKIGDLDFILKEPPSEELLSKFPEFKEGISKLGSHRWYANYKGVKIDFVLDPERYNPEPLIVEYSGRILYLQTSQKIKSLYLELGKNDKVKMIEEQEMRMGNNRPSDD